MRFRRMPAKAAVSLSIPRLNGGINVYDVPNRAGDNQLTDSNNLWWHGGALRTRPGVVVDETQWREVDTYTIRQPVGDREVLLARFAQRDGVSRFHAAHLNLEDGYQRLGFWEEGYTLQNEKSAESALGIRAKKNADTRWYYLLQNGEIIKEAYGTDTGEGWVAAEPYIPTVLLNGVGEECEADAEPSAYEDYNMLTRAFRCHFTTDGTSTTWKLPLGNLATDLPGDALDSEAGGIAARVEVDVCDGATVRTIAVDMVVNDNGVVSVMEVPITQAEAGVTDYSDIRLVLRFNLQKGELSTGLEGRDTSTAQGGRVTLPCGLPFITANNLRITAWRGREHEAQRRTICRMTRGEWFGGDSSGIAGGTRFFVCGNPAEPDLLCWSGIEHPLYFPEHNRVRVGDGQQAITAMGKQGSLLVLFKEREMYALQYSSGTENDYNFAQSGGVAVTSYMATFLLAPINASVGCDCPDTVRLVNNRLVWACSGGDVYMLTAVNQYSERNVRMISRNVRKLIAECGKETLQDAQAGEYEGYYLLLAGNRVFLMNTQTNAFASFNYYDDEDAAAKAIPWYAWTLPEHLTYTGMLSGNNDVMLMVTDSQRGEGTVARLDGANPTDAGNPIPCRMATKLWDFGIPDHKKSIETLYVGIGCEDISGVQVTYITERGRFHDPYRMKNGLQSDGSYLLRRRLTPNVRMVQAFGLCLDSPAAMELDEIQIKVRQQGVVR